MPVEMEKIVSLCKRRGFVFPGSEIYGGLGSTWDYGPLGAEMKRNIKDCWWRRVVYDRGDMEGLDSGILMHPEVWKASGHADGFADLLRDCKQCRKRFRADKLEKERCPECDGELTEARPFNLMLETHLGAVKDEATRVFLRPETAQGIFVNFSSVQMSMRRKLPFGIAQIGKAFRNEVTFGNFVFRCREFEQMEIEFFVRPGTDEEWHRRWIGERLQWYLDLGVKKENLRLREHARDELAHYARACTDIEYLFPIGWSELEGIANRQTFDLTQHAKHSGKELSYFDEETKEKIVPLVIEPSAGVDRSFLAFLTDAYREEEVRGEKRVVLGLHRDLVPVKAAVLPLLRNRPELVALAQDIYRGIRKKIKVVYDDTASIGRLYRRQDEIGTLYCITVDVQSLEDKQVTVRERDSMSQVRIPAVGVNEYLREKLS